jgi:hypothetical protein
MCRLVTYFGRKKKVGFPIGPFVSNFSEDLGDVSFRIIDIGRAVKSGSTVNRGVQPEDYVYVSFQIAKLNRDYEANELITAERLTEEYYHGVVLPDPHSWIGKVVQLEKCSKSIHKVCVVKAPKDMTPLDTQPTHLLDAIDSLLVQT